MSTDPSVALDLCREASLYASRYRLVLPERSLRGLHGEVLGRMTGGAVEFHDHRSYAPGDDVRHVDWLVYGRTGELVLKMYREEVTPVVELVLDTSRSMALYPEKEACARKAVLFFAELARREGLSPLGWACGDAVRRISGDLAEWACTASFSGRSPLPLLLEGRLRLRPNTVRVVISDFLFPHRAEVLVRRAAAGAAAACLLQLLCREERDPAFSGGYLLEDCESGEAVGIRVGRAEVRRYRRRMDALVRALDEHARRAGVCFVRAEAEKGLAHVTERLVRARWIEPA